MITVELGKQRAEDERFVVTARGFDSTLEMAGRERLIDLGVLDPN